MNIRFNFLFKLSCLKLNESTSEILKVTPSQNSYEKTKQGVRYTRTVASPASNRGNLIKVLLQLSFKKLCKVIFVVFKNNHTENITCLSVIPIKHLHVHWQNYTSKEGRGKL